MLMPWKTLLMKLFKLLKKYFYVFDISPRLRKAGPQRKRDKLKFDEKIKKIYIIKIEILI
jgi:hypothetical protein